MLTKIKICGLTRWEDAKFVAEQGADFLGFIHSDKSKRNASLDSIQKLISQVHSEYPSVLTVCVVTTDDISEIEMIISKTNCDYIQVHNDMNVAYFNRIQFQNKIKVFRVSNDTKISDIDQYQSPYYLWDTHDKDHMGGTGKRFNWDLIPKKYLPRSFVAGGINDQNISNLIPKYQPFSVDISSSVETEPGKKSKLKLQKLFQSIR